MEKNVIPIRKKFERKDIAGANQKSAILKACYHFSRDSKSVVLQRNTKQDQ